MTRPLYEEYVPTTLWSGHTRPDSSTRPFFFESPLVFTVMFANIYFRLRGSSGTSSKSIP